MSGVQPGMSAFDGRGGRSRPTAAQPGGRPGRPAPRAVTRGESPQAVKIDWINATFPKPALSVDGFVQIIGRMLGRPVWAVEGRGLIGFRESVVIHAKHGSVSSPIGTVAWGGDSQHGRWLFQLTGVGCQLVRDWEGMADFLESLESKLTRVDLALDFLAGEHSVDEAVTLYELGGFQLSGRAPQSRLDGDWLGGTYGRTFYVGSGKNGKLLRVYEKGKQLGDAQSEWTRFEVQLGSRDRVIPFAALTQRDAYFAGCYPALQSMVEHAARDIPTLQKGGETTLAHLLYHLKRCYGKVLHTCAQEVGAVDAELVQELRVIGLPRRVPLSSMAAGVNWADLKAQAKRVFL